MISEMQDLETSTNLIQIHDIDYVIQLIFYRTSWTIGAVLLFFHAVPSCCSSGIDEILVQVGRGKRSSYCYFGKVMHPCV